MARASTVNHSDIEWMGKIRAKWHPPECLIMKASRLGLEGEELNRIQCDCDGESEEKSNTVLLTGLYSIVNKLIDFTNTNTTDGFISYIEFGLSATAANSSQLGLILPKARKLMTESDRDTTNAYFKTVFTGIEGASAQTAVVSGASNTQFTVTGGTGTLFAVGQTIIVGSDVTIITGISTDTFTVSPALAGTPIGGEVVAQAIAEVGLYGGSTATSTLGSGIGFARTTVSTPSAKPTSYGLTIEWTVSLL